jgi:hypothetical protein
MNKFRNRKRLVLVTAFFAVSSFALAPGMLRDNSRIAAVLERIQPQLHKPSPQLAPPHFLLTPPEPDYTLPALPVQDRVESDESHAQSQPEFEIAVAGRSIVGTKSLWLDNYNAGSGSGSRQSHGGSHSRHAGDGGAGGSASVSPRQTFTEPQDRDPAAPATTDEKPTTEEETSGNTELAANDIPDADDLHNPISNPSNNPGDKDQPPTGTPTVAVPEPSSLVLLIAGIAGLVLCRRHSKTA